MCLHASYDKHESVFNVINAFDFPHLKYDIERKLYLPSERKVTFLPEAEFKAKLFFDRYSAVLQRTQRNFKNKITENEKDRLILQTVDYLLTSSTVILDRTLILGSLIQVSEGKYYLEDPSGIVGLDLSHAK